MGDLLADATFAPRCHAAWVTLLPEEVGAPERRIIHSRGVGLPSVVRLNRLGLRSTMGYFKCGSERETDWVTAFRVLAWQDDRWEVVRYERDLPRPSDERAIHWFDLDGVETSAVLVEARQCGIDGWWPSWNVAMGSFVLEASAPPPSQTPRATTLRLVDCDVDRLPAGVAAERRGSEVRYRTRFLEVGFGLGRAGFSYLALDDEGLGRTQSNLLRFGTGWRHPLRDYWTQGLCLCPVAETPVASFLAHDVDGEVRVLGNVVTYDVRSAGTGQRYQLRWEVLEDRLVAEVERFGERPLRAWESSAWRIAFDSKVTPTTVLGRVTKHGQAGMLELPVLLHAPGHGSLRVDAVAGSALWRADSARPITTTTSELKIGEVPQPEGDYRLLAGHHRAAIELVVTQHRMVTREGTPPEIERALRRCALTALTYRPDTATFSNNGNSMHAPICMDSWSAVAIRIGPILPELDARDLLRDSLERWLDGAPGYASGRTSRADYYLEDEYLMTGTASLLGLAEYLGSWASPAWVARFGQRIGDEIRRMRQRDLDGDGLVESPHRLGISGQHQWSTNWWDVISFGWKDAFANALLYSALRQLAEALPRLGQASLASGLAEWADRLRANYLPTFFNPATGWLAGWRCKEDRLHDYAFLFVNGAAVSAGLVDDDLARSIVGRLWEEMKRVGIRDYRLGLPGNLWPIPDADTAAPQHGLPMGCYQNGGLTHSQARHFVAALYQVGMVDEADRVLTGLCASLGDASAFGGCGSGVDWRRWDGLPSGYEGLLCDQFGVLALAIDRFRCRDECPESGGLGVSRR